MEETYETKILKLQTQLFHQDALALYIPPQVSAGSVADGESAQDAAHVIKSWLSSDDAQCLLLMGDSGAGKTLLGQWLASQNFDGRIPLFIPLLAYRNPTENLIDKHLKKACGIKDENERKRIQQQPLLIILDGFDEMHRKVNLYRSNELWQLPNAKILISCRSQWLATVENYRTLFYPCDHQANFLSNQLQEYTVTPFSAPQIDAYLKKYVTLKQAELSWQDWRQYQAYIEKLPGLKNLLSSPFILSLVVEVLPHIIAQHQEQTPLEQLRLARIDLYESFVAQWFKRQKQKLVKAGHMGDNCPIEDAYRLYSTKLAHAMLQAKVTSVQYVPQKTAHLLQSQGLFASSPSVEASEDPWAAFFAESAVMVGDDSIKLSFIRAGCPLMQVGENTYAFLHKSLLEYFAARKLFEGAMAVASIGLGLELNTKLLTDEPETLAFMAEKVQEDEALKDRLFDLLEESKYDDRVEIAAANAITVLNTARVSFSQRDFKHIRIKGADLSHAILDHTDLRDADLREVSLQGAWLRQAKLGGALMQAVTFGELPYLTTGGATVCMAYSKDGIYLAAGTGNKIILYQQKEKEYQKVAEFKGHTSYVNSVAFDPQGQWLASGSDDTTVRLWEIKSQTCLAEFKGHTYDVTSVAFDPQGQWLASGSNDDTVRLWEIKSQKCLAAFKGHTDSVTSVAFDPQGQWLASGSYDETVRLWEIKSQKCLAEFKGHTNWVTSVAFDPQGQWLASGSRDWTVRLWEIKSQKCLAEFKGHTGSVKSVAFDPQGQWLASGSIDETVRWWEIKSQKSLTAFKGHTKEVNSVAFDPQGQWLASGSDDQTVRLWEIKSQKCLAEFKGHTDDVKSVAFDPQGQWLASGSVDKTVRLWDMQMKQCVKKMTFTHFIASLSFGQSAGNLWLGVGSGTDIYTFAVKKLQNKVALIFIGSSGKTSLTSEQLDMGGVIGLELTQEQLLKQHQAIGKPSQKKTEKELERRNALTAYNPKLPPRDLLSGQHFITPQQAMVSLARKRSGEGSEHVFLIIETVENGYYKMITADFYLDTRKPHEKLGFWSSGQALIEICTKPLREMQELAKHCVYRPPWPIATESARKLLDNLEADRRERINYLNTGNSSLYGLGEEKHNCLSWCEKHLEDMGLDLSAQKSWLDVVLVYPAWHLPANDPADQDELKEQEPDSRCLVM